MINKYEFDIFTLLIKLSLLPNGFDQRRFPTYFPKESVLNTTQKPAFRILYKRVSLSSIVNKKCIPHWTFICSKGGSKKLVKSTEVREREESKRSNGVQD